MAPPSWPMKNGFVQSFNGRMRQGPLNEVLLLTLGHARHHRRLGGGLSTEAPLLAYVKLPTAYAAGLARHGYFAPHI